MDKIHLKAAVRKVLPYFFTDFLVIIALYVALKYRGANIILMRTSAFCTLIYFSSLAESGALYKASAFVQGFVYVLVGIALVVVMVNRRREYQYNKLKILSVYSYHSLRFL